MGIWLSYNLIAKGIGGSPYDISSGRWQVNPPQDFTIGGKLDNDIFLGGLFDIGEENVIYMEHRHIIRVDKYGVLLIPNRRIFRPLEAIPGNEEIIVTKKGLKEGENHGKVTLAEIIESERRIIFVRDLRSTAHTHAKRDDGWVRCIQSYASLTFGEIVQTKPGYMPRFYLVVGLSLESKVTDPKLIQKLEDEETKCDHRDDTRILQGPQ